MFIRRTSRKSGAIGKNERISEDSWHKLKDTLAFSLIIIIIEEGCP